jgi:hypothetical protein
MSDTPQVLLAHRLKALKPPTSYASTAGWPGHARPRALIISATSCAWPSRS